MNKIIQKRKIKTKEDLLTELIGSLAEYNNIEGYNNQKKFKVEVSYLKNDYSLNYNYIINIIRGINDPKNVFNMRFTSDENVNNTILEFTHNLMKNKFYSHTTYTKGENNEYIAFNIHLVNDVLISLSIKNIQELNMFKELEKLYETKEIVINVPKESNKTKDELKKEKADKTINLFKKTMNILENYNSIEDYKNTKPYKLVISNKYNKECDCFDYTFSIVRGKINPENFLTLNASLKNNKYMYDIIYELLISLKSNDNYLQDTIQTNGEEKYIIDMSNDISYEILFSNDFDRLFYKGFQEATNHTLNPNNKTSLKKILKNNWNI